MHQGFFENHDIAIFVNECVYHGLLAVEKHSNAVSVIKFSQGMFFLKGHSVQYMQ